MESLYGLIGYPLLHSFSKKYFTEKFLREGITNSRYELFEIPSITELPALIRREENLRGLNVTIPYKEQVLPLLNELSPEAEKIGAVNCISITRKNNTIHLAGSNTDAAGFRQSIKPFLESHHERALILGTGGSAKAVHYVLSQIGVDCYFVSRTPAARNHFFSYEELNEHVMRAFRLIINTTPVGQFPQVSGAPPIPYELLTASHLLYDLIYNPEETEFLKRGKLQGAATVNGLSMLKEQAEEAWRRWNP